MMHRFISLMCAAIFVFGMGFFVVAFAMLVTGAWY